MTLVLALLFVLNLSTGAVSIPVADVFEALIPGNAASATTRSIVLDFRMTKALTCILAGAGLSLGGLQMQTLFRNPLAGPDILGLTSGASLAVGIVFLSGAGSISPNPWTVALASTAGCAVIFAIILGVSFRLQDNVSLLIIGLMIGAGTFSVVSVLQYLSDAEQLQIYVLWSFGSLGSLNWLEIYVLAAGVAIGLVLALINIKPLNVWLLGNNYASSMGVNIGRSRLMMIGSASVLTGAVTAFCGPVAFVGLAVPHLVKLVFPTTNHRDLIPGVMLGGASLLLLCDVICQLPKSFVLPVNAVTAMIGAPVVIWIVLRSRTVRL